MAGVLKLPDWLFDGTELVALNAGLQDGGLTLYGDYVN